MKKQFFYLLVVGIFFLHPLQSIAQSEYSIGLIAGLNLGKWKYDQETPYGENKFKNGLIVKIPVELRTGKNFAIQLEPSFIQKGNRFLSTDNSFASYATINYIELPVILKFIAGKNMKVGICIGPQVAYGISGNSKYSGTGLPQTTRSIDFEKDEVSRLDLSGSAGIELKAPGKKLNMIMSVRYAYGFTDLSTEEPNTFKVNSQGIYITFGFLYPLHKKEKVAVSTPASG